MSVYNAYPAQGPAAPYYSQPHQPQSYQQQYPAYYATPVLQVPTLDENSFRSLYAQRLGALTVNSRPIIQDLSMLAQNYPQMAHIVVDCIERQVRTVSCHDILTQFCLRYGLGSLRTQTLESYLVHDSIAIVADLISVFCEFDENPTGACFCLNCPY
jgi:hypothetical protein